MWTDYLNKILNPNLPQPRTESQMVDFTQLYSRPAGKTPAPKALPIEWYPGVITKYEFVESFQPPVPALRIHARLTGWPKDPKTGEDILRPDEMTQLDPDGKEVQRDISKSQFRRDMATPEDLSDRAWYYLDEFFRSCGLDPTSHSYNELFPMLINMPVKVHVTQYVNKESGDIGNQIDRVVGTAS